MKQTVAYQCPCCGAPLAYNGTSGKLECEACGNAFETEALDAMNEGGEAQSIAFEMPTQTFEGAEAEQMKSFTCKACGAELLTEGTTTATECPYCGSPTVLPERLSDSVRPEKVIPFKVTKEEAQKQFEDYFKGKRLLPNVFLNGRNRISEMRKLYVPYWLFDCEAEADMVFDAEKVDTRRQGEWEIKRTRHYVVHRQGTMGFENIPVDGSEKMDDKITESLEPYDMSEAVPFQPAVLAGAMADRADVDAEVCEKRASERVQKSMEQQIRGTVEGYSNVRTRHESYSAEKGKVTSALMPVWLITTQKEEKTYTFAINGQSGKLTCDVPADKRKATLWGAGIFVGVMAVALVILWLLKQLASGTALIAGIVALIAAFAVVGSMKAKLKQAVFQSGAKQFIREGSFKLLRHSDHFLYETVDRRKVENKPDNK